MKPAVRAPLLPLLMPLMVSTPSSSLLSLVCHRNSARDDDSTWRSMRCSSTVRNSTSSVTVTHSGHGLHHGREGGNFEKVSEVLTKCTVNVLTKYTVIQLVSDLRCEILVFIIQPNKVCFTNQLEQKKIKTKCW